MPRGAQPKKERQSTCPHLDELCHPERSRHSAKRRAGGVEGSLLSCTQSESRGVQILCSVQRNTRCCHGEDMAVGILRLHADAASRPQHCAQDDIGKVTRPTRRTYFPPPLALVRTHPAIRVTGRWPPANARRRYLASHHPQVRVNVLPRIQPEARSQDFALSSPAQAWPQPFQSKCLPSHQLPFRDSRSY
jgi:hypothetical protein